MKKDALKLLILELNFLKDDEIIARFEFENETNRIDRFLLVSHGLFILGIIFFLPLFSFILGG